VLRGALNQLDKSLSPANVHSLKHENSLSVQSHVSPLYTTLAVPSLLDRSNFESQRLIPRKLNEKTQEDLAQAAS